MLPTGHSTARGLQLAVPDKYKAASVLQFCIFLANSVLSEVETSESFSQVWVALGSPNFWRKRLIWW